MRQRAGKQIMPPSLKPILSRLKSAAVARRTGTVHQLTELNIFTDLL
jgi:hypothetical protein